MDHAGIDLLQCRAFDTEVAHHARAEVFPEDIAHPDQLLEDIHPFRLTQIEREVALVVVMHSERRDPDVRAAPGLCLDPPLRRHAGRLLDPNQLGAQISQNAATHGPNHAAAQVQDAYPVQRAATHGSRGARTGDDWCAARTGFGRSVE